MMVNDLNRKLFSITPKIKVKKSLYRPGQTLRVPGS
jgi:hypothetical protein